MANIHVLTDPDGKVVHPEVRRIANADIFDALRRGLDDFRGKPTHYAFLSLIYIVVGCVLVFSASGGNALQLVFPLMTGFALLGPVAAIWLYEISRRGELGLDTSWRHVLEVTRSPAIPAIVAVGAMLVVLFIAWLYAAQTIYQWQFGAAPPESISGFIAQVLTTPRGWALIIVGNAVGFIFALAVLCTTVIAFPLLLDRDVGARAAVETSMRAVRTNPTQTILWGLIVAVLLLAGSIPLFVGLAVVMPVLGHATWHLYRKLV